MPPALVPIRDRIKDALVARLYTIKEGGDYWTTPALVTRQLLAIDQYKTELATGPVLGVMRGSGSTLEQIAQPAEFEHGLVVSVWGYVRGTDLAPADPALERLWDDVARCLLQETTLAGLVRDIRPTGTLDTDDGALEPHGFFAQDWLVTADQTIGG